MTWNRVANLSVSMALASGLGVVGAGPLWRAARADPVPELPAAVIATNIPGASALSQVGEFLNKAPPLGTACASPIPRNFPQFTQAGAVLDSKRLLVGSLSNF